MTLEQLAFFTVPPLVGAGIGWFTNVLAVKLIFRPRRARRILGVRVQGLVPKRQSELAEAVGEVVARELIHHDDLRAAVSGPEFAAHLTEALDARFDEFLKQKLGAISPMLTALVPPKLISNIKYGILAEIAEQLPRLMDDFLDHLESKLDIRQIVVDKVRAFEVERLEQIVRSIAAKELKHIEILGAVLGFVIGAVQVGVAVALGIAP